MKTIYFVRHGQSESNITDVLSGGGNDIHLTETGRNQAAEAGKKLRDKYIQLVVCSPLIRTVDTATIIAKQIGYSSNDIVRNPLLIERDYGIYDGGSIKIYQEALANNKVHPSVETTRQMHERFSKALEWLKGLPEERIVVVSHGGARRAFHVINENLHHSHMYKLESFGNGEIYEFSL